PSVPFFLELAPICKRRVLTVLNFLNSRARVTQLFTYGGVPVAECFDARRAQKALGSKSRQGVTPAGLEVAAGPVAHRSVALPTRPLEQGARPLRPS
ncbi:unnamed protein product, partial [Prunus brigantina]